MDQGKHKEIRHQGEHPEEVLADETWRSESVRETRTEQTNCVRETPTHFLHKLPAVR